MDLKNQVAIVTGAGQGIGRAYANRLAADGASVVIADINVENARSVEKAIKEKGLKAMAVKVDVSKEEDLKRLMEATENEFGFVDILVNNAAIFSAIELKPFDEISLEEWDKVISVNLTGMFLACKAVVPHMKQKQYGRIINMSSGTVLNGRPNYLHYVSSKSGIVGLTRALAREVGQWNITVNTISAGPIITEISRASEDHARRVAEQEQCIRRVGTPEDLVGIVSFLSSEEAGFISGQWINVDGGKAFR